LVGSALKAVAGLPGSRVAGCVSLNMVDRF